MVAPYALITGSGGMLGHALTRVLAERNLPVVALEKSRLDVTNAELVRAALEEHQPGVVIHCAAFTHVDKAESQASTARVVNEEGTANVAAACARIGARLVYPSTDYVFDGTARMPYAPDAPPNPINEYGRTKLAGERAAQDARDYLILRTGWLYGSGGRNFVRTITERIAAGSPLTIVDDQFGSPTWTMELAARILDLISADAESGTYHITAAGSTSWYEFAVEITRQLHVQSAITPTPTSGYRNTAPRPAYSVLDCARTDAIIGPAPHWRDSLAQAMAAHSY